MVPLVLNRDSGERGSTLAPKASRFDMMMASKGFNYRPGPINPSNKRVGRFRDLVVMCSGFCYSIIVRFVIE